jgi:hypothetical protein
MTINKNINYNGQVKIGDIVVAQLNANISANGGINISKTIQDQETYLANKKAVLDEIAEFENTVLGDVK